MECDSLCSFAIVYSIIPKYQYRDVVFMYTHIIISIPLAI